MEWISVKKRLPKIDQTVLVSNSKGWMYSVRATFHPKPGVFILHDPNYRETLLLEVTHWLPIPDWIRE